MVSDKSVKVQAVEKAVKKLMAQLEEEFGKANKIDPEDFISTVLNTGAMPLEIRMSAAKSLLSCKLRREMAEMSLKRAELIRSSKFKEKEVEDDDDLRGTEWEGLLD